jgi:hypothetical protein
MKRSECHLRHVLGRIADHSINKIDEILSWKVIVIA